MATHATTIPRIQPLAHLQSWVRGRGWWLWGLAVAVASLGLGLYRTNVTSLWFDETFAVGLASQPLSSMLHYLWGTEDQMTLYYVLLHGWLKVLHALGLPATEMLVRLPSTVCVALTAVVLTLLGWRYFTPLAGIVAGLVFALNPLVLADAQLTRTYALQLLLLSLAWYAFLAALEPGRANIEQGHNPTIRWRWWGTLALMDLLAIYAQVDSVLVIACQALAFALLLVDPGRWQAMARRALWAYVAAMAFVGLLIAPLALDVVKHQAGNGWVPPAQPEAVGGLLHDTIAGQSFSYAFLLVVLLVLAVFPLLVLLLGESRMARTITASRRWPLVGARSDAPAIAVVLCWLLGSFVLFYIISRPALNLHLFWPRYLSVLLPPLCLLVGVGVTGVRSRWLAMALALVVVLSAVRVLPRYYASAELQNFRQPATWLAQHIQPGDGVLCYPGGLCSIPLDYYLRLDLPAASVPIGYPGDYDWSNGETASDHGEPFTTYLQQHSRLFLVTALHGDTLSQQAGLLTMQAVLGERQFQAVANYQTPTVQVTLYAMTP